MAKYAIISLMLIQSVPIIFILTLFRRIFKRSLRFQKIRSSKTPKLILVWGVCYGITVLRPSTKFFEPGTVIGINIQVLKYVTCFRFVLLMENRPIGDPPPNRQWNFQPLVSNIKFWYFPGFVGVSMCVANVTILSINYEYKMAA